MWKPLALSRCIMADAHWRGARPMRIVLDENLPRPLARTFGPGHQVVTVQELGLAGTANGALLARSAALHPLSSAVDIDSR